MQTRLHILTLLSMAMALPTSAQDATGWFSNPKLSGSIQSDILVPTEKTIGTEEISEWALTNTYLDLSLQTNHVDVGGRVEYLDHPLPGYESDFEGWGLANIYVKLHFDKVELTGGNVYEQFGSGFILRTYEERSLGIDNSIMGAKAIVEPLAGVRLKALTGRQRNYWDYNEAWLTGADVELSPDRWLKGMAEKGTYLTLGFSWVNKHESQEDIYTDQTHKLNLPENVNAFDVRATLQKGAFSLLGEYAWKTQDPSLDNGYIYKRGDVAMLSASYSKSGLSVLLQAKRSDNMSMRSKRSTSGTSSYINHLPAFTMEHTYALAALYPYATNPDGEWAYQAEVGYRIKKGTPLGGKYGTGLKLNFSYINGIDKQTKDGGERGTDGYTSKFWKWGDGKYYQDINLQLDKKISKNFKLNLMYMNQYYNKTVVEGEGGMIHSNIYVAEGKWRINYKLTLRAEAQYLSTDDDEGDWLYGLVELSVVPHWMITVADMYNSGLTDKHYYQGSLTYNAGAHRIQLGYGKTRAGYNCSGGVCRYVPQTEGFTLSYNYNF